MAEFLKDFKYYFLAALFSGAIFVWYAVVAESRNGLEVDFLDAGQGDAIFIQAPNGNQILIDGGPPGKKVLRSLSEVMPFYDRTIDAVVSTHPHLDHYGGLMDVLKKYQVNFELDSRSGNGESPAFKQYEELLDEKRIARAPAKRGMRINLDKGLYLDILLPVLNEKKLSPHDGMVAAKLVYKNNSFLLVGDMEDNLENYLLFLGDDIKSDVLKVGHHGSKTSTSESFLGFVDPDYAIISAGEKNKYGHPHKEVIERLGRFKIPILRTDERGTIKMRSDGERIYVLE